MNVDVSSSVQEDDEEKGKFLLFFLSSFLSLNPLTSFNEVVITIGLQEKEIKARKGEREGHHCLPLHLT